jgi:hypothetical protein
MTTPEEANEKKRQPLQSYTKDLICKLHAEEVADHAQRLAAIEEDLSAHNERAKSIKADLNAAEAKLVAERTSLARKVRTKEETRPVRVNVVADFEMGKAISERSDTGEVLESRALTDKERQTAMFMDAHKDDARSAKEIAEDLFKDAGQEQAYPPVKPEPVVRRMKMIDVPPKEDSKEPTDE